MALRTPLTAQPHLYIGDSTGRPLDYGRVYFGEPNKDPELYPIDIYLDPEMTIAAAQPVRTKGGFMDVGGNLAELHAAEVIYSLKVLDQYGRQVFYKPEMYRNNVSDFLVDEITRATAAETLIAGNLTAETQRAIAAEKVIADAVVAEKDRAVAAEDALDIKHAALSSTINSLGGGKKAYTTYALMVADKNNIAANSSIDVTNDTDPLKNGTYSYDGAVFAKSIYDVETIVRTKVLNTFKIKALMDASVLPDGADAQVTDDAVNNGLYVKTAGAWVKSDYKFDAEALGKLAELEPVTNSLESTSLVAFSVSDGRGLPSVVVDNDGVLKAKKLEAGELSTSALGVDSLDIGDVNLSDSESVFSVSDASGNPSIRVNADGSFSVKTLIVDGEKLDLENLPSNSNGNNTEGSFLANLNHLEIFGQSVSIGAYSSPIQTTEQKYDSLMFSGGTRVEHPNYLDVGFFDDFIPLVEAEDASGYVGFETPLSGASESIKQLIEKENGISFEQQEYRILGTASGQGGMGLEALSTTYLEQNLKPAITNAYNLAQSKGMTYAMPLIGWVHGEQDNKPAVGTTIAEYKQGIKDLMQSIDSHLKTLNPDLELKGMVASQLSSFASSGRSEPYIELAIYEDAIDPNSNVYLACPQYIFNYRDNFHILGVDSKVLGAYIGLTYKRVVVDGENWLPIHPISHVKQGRILEVKFHVPVRPLVFDDGIVAKNENYGFSLVDNAGEGIGIESVKITQEDTIRIIATADIPSGSILRYAWTPTSSVGRLKGARGNLRDSQGGSIVFDKGGLNYPLHNWTPIFQYEV